MRVIWEDSSLETKNDLHGRLQIEDIRKQIVKDDLGD